MFYILPFVGAILWGAYYAFAGEGLKSISVPTWYFLFGVASVIISVIMHQTSKEGVNLTPLLDKRVFWVVLAAIVSAKLAEIVVTYSLIYSSPTFAAFGEAMYPLFVPIFVYLLYGQNQMNTQSIIGGCVMVIGIYIFVMGHQRHEKEQEELKLAAVESQEKLDNSVAIAIPVIEAKL